MKQHFCNEVQVFYYMSCGPSWWVFFTPPSPLQYRSSYQMDSNQGLKKGLCNIAMSLSKLQASQDFGLKLSAGISQYKTMLGFPMAVRPHPYECGKKGMVCQHQLIQLFAITQTAH